MLAVFRTEQFVLDIEVRHDAVGLLLLPRLVGVCHRVADVDDVNQLLGSVVAIVRRETISHGVHQEELARIVVILVVTVDAGIGSHSHCHSEQCVVRTVVLAAAVGIVLQVVGISQREVGREADAVRHVVVQHETCGETVQTLLDDSTQLVVIAG